MATTALTPPTCTFWAGLGLSPGSPGTPVGWSLPCPSVPPLRPAPSSRLVYRGQLAPGHKDTLLAGDPVNMREIKKPAAWPGQTLSPHWGKGTRGEGNQRERAPLILPTTSPQPRTESGFSGGICPSVAPCPLHTKAPGTPAALSQEQREGAARKPCRPKSRGTKQRSRPPPELPALTPRPPGSGAARRPPAFAGCGGSALAGLTVGAVDAGVLVVTEEKAAVALTLVAAHGVDADLLAAAVVVLTLVHICGKRRGKRSHLGRK